MVEASFIKIALDYYDQVSGWNEKVGRPYLDGDPSLNSLIYMIPMVELLLIFMSKVRHTLSHRL